MIHHRRRRWHRRVAALVASSLVAIDLTMGGAGGAAGATTTVPLVVLSDTPLTPAQISSATGGTGRLAERLPEIGATVVEVPAARSAGAIRRLDAMRGVRSVARDGGVTAFDVIPTDPSWPSQDSMRAVGAPAAWAESTGSPSVVIAIIDSGVNEAADLAGRVLPGFDFVNGDSDASDDAGHGTDAALVAAAAGNDGVGAAGLCWNCKVLPVKVLDRDGSGSMFDVAAGIVWATNHGADVINLSLGGPGTDQAVVDALAYAFANDVVVVASAGNEGGTTRNYPAANDGVLSVTGSTIDTRTLYPWAQRGPTWVDVAAPGCNWVVDEDGLYRFCGTSSAAPLVAGLAGLVRSVRPSADRRMVATAIATTAEFAPTRDLVGYGIVDAAASVRAIGGVVPGPTPLPPDVTPPDIALDVPTTYEKDWSSVRVLSEDDQRVELAEIDIDGRTLPAVFDPAGVQEFSFDSRDYGDGPHTIVGRIRDGAGHVVSTTASTINIDNVNPVGILTNPSAGARVTGSFIARVFVTDPSGIMGTFLIANDQVVGGFLGAGWGQAVVPVTRSGPVRVVAITVDRAGRISGTNSAVVTASVARRRARR